MLHELGVASAIAGVHNNPWKQALVKESVASTKNILDPHFYYADFR